MNFRTQLSCTAGNRCLISISTLSTPKRPRTTLINSKSRWRRAHYFSSTTIGNDNVFLFKASCNKNEIESIPSKVLENLGLKEQQVKYQETAEILQLSSTVLDSMINSAILSKDAETLRMTLVEASKLGNLRSEMILDTLRKCVNTKMVDVCTSIIDIARENKCNIPEDLSNVVLSKGIATLNWLCSGEITLYMIEKNYPVHTTHIFSVVSGLLSSPIASTSALGLDLITQVVRYKRKDIAAELPLARVYLYARGQSDPNVNDASNDLLDEEGKLVGEVDKTKEKRSEQNVLSTVDEKALSEVMTTCITVLRTERWYSSAILNLVMYLAYASDLSDMADSFIRNVVTVALESKQDVISIIRNSTHILKLKAYPSLAPTLLDLLVSSMPSSQFHSGPFYSEMFAKTYWLLSYYVAIADPSGYSLADPPRDEQEDAYRSLSWSYHQLTALFNDPYKAQGYFSPAPGLERANFSVLCDEIGLMHVYEPSTRQKKASSSSLGTEGAGYAGGSPSSLLSANPRDDGLILLVMKSDSEEKGLFAPSLESILSWDAKRGLGRRLHAPPPYWNVVRKELLLLEPEELTKLGTTLLSSMMDYPCAPWGLLLLDTLLQRPGCEDVPLKFFLPLLSMCARSRPDVYAALEVVAAAKCLGRELSTREWKFACYAALDSKRLDMPRESYRGAFMELMKRLQAQGVELDMSTMRVLLRFLVITQPDGDTTSRVLKVLYRDKTLDVGYSECAVLSQLLLRYVNMYPPLLALAYPHFKTPHYLFCYAQVRSKIAQRVTACSEVLGSDFVKRFKSIWVGGLDGPATKANQQAYDFLLEKVQEPQLRARLISEEQDALTTVALAATYISYMVAKMYGNYREAFDLIYVVYTMVEEVVAAEKRSQSKEAQFPSKYDN